MQYFWNKLNQVQNLGNTLQWQLLNFHIMSSVLVSIRGFVLELLYPFHLACLFLYSLKTLENTKFLSVFRRYRKRSMTKNWPIWFSRDNAISHLHYMEWRYEVAHDGKNEWIKGRKGFRELFFRRDLLFLVFLQGDWPILFAATFFCFSWFNSNILTCSLDTYPDLKVHNMIC